jgi:hypothetical protein
LTDPRVITLLTTEHWSILSARSLAYNEAFVRAGMFLTFLSMSFVALGLLAQATGFGRDFLAIATAILAFDFVIGLTTYGRILGANEDDLRAVHGMARIRHGYTQIAPIVGRYFTSPIHDDVASVSLTYGPPSQSVIGDVLYGFSTSAGMIGLIVAMIAGVLGTVVGLLIGIGVGVAVWIGLAVAVIVFGALLAWVLIGVPRAQAALGSLFPAPPQEPVDAAMD